MLRLVDTVLILINTGQSYVKYNVNGKHEKIGFQTVCRDRWKLVQCSREILAELEEQNAHAIPKNLSQYHAWSYYIL